MERLFVDTGAWFAFINRRDRDHAPVARALREHRGRLVSTNFVFDELATLARMRMGHAVASRAGAALRDPALVDFVRVTAADENAAWDLFLERPDQRYSFTDCTSFVVMRRMDLKRAAATDRHFAREGFEVVPAIGRR